MIPFNQTTTGKAPLARRFERKFFLAPAKVEWARHLLKHLCPADRQFPAGTIHSVYYDSPDLDSYHAAEEGSYHRDKIRIRWYNQAEAEGAAVGAWLELKTKDGFAGVKQRQEIAIPPGRFDKSGMMRGLIPRDQMLQGLARFGFYPQGSLQPTLLVTYRRLRFTELMTRTRISLDWEIRSMLLAPRHDRQEGFLAMQGAVLEIKGPTMALPESLKALRLLESDWTRYSKYGTCMDAQLESVGASGRLWPSGRTS